MQELMDQRKIDTFFGKQI